jgi:hypothetical protein
MKIEISIVIIVVQNEGKFNVSVFSMCFTSTTCHQLRFLFFSSGCQLHATEIFEVSQITARSMLDAISAMSVAIASHALDEKANWSFVTIPDFESR